jgi:hypothetical protein
MEHASTSVAFEAYKHILKEAAAILPKGCPREIRLLLGPVSLETWLDWALEHLEAFGVYPIKWTCSHFRMM